MKLDHKEILWNRNTRQWN